MAVRRIHTWPDDVLRRKAAPVEDFGDEFQSLVDDMLETMYAAPGVGLAAPQVGVPKRLFVIDTSSDTEPGQVIVLANPEIVEAEDEVEFEEGCLSVPDYTAKVKRARRVAVRGHNRLGQPSRCARAPAGPRALQHEYDYLEGVLFIDHSAVPPGSRRRSQEGPRGPRGRASRARGEGRLSALELAVLSLPRRAPARRRVLTQPTAQGLRRKLAEPHQAGASSPAGAPAGKARRGASAAGLERAGAEAAVVVATG
jgi:peptide deformylase